MVAEEKAQLDFVAIAAELAPIIKENSVRINEERQIPSEIAEDLADRGFFRLLLPKSLGGTELNHSEFLDILEIIAESFVIYSLINLNRTSFLEVDICFMINL